MVRMTEHGASEALLEENKRLAEALALLLSIEMTMKCTYCGAVLESHSLEMHNAEAFERARLADLEHSAVCMRDPRRGASYPILTELLGPQLHEMERIVAVGRAGKYVQDTLTDHGADHHFAKADSHLVRSGVHYTAHDEDTGSRHILLASLRLMMADACTQMEAKS